MPSETLISHFEPSSSPLNSSKPLNPPSTTSSPPHPTLTHPMTHTKSSNWLHRLRSSRGFPDSDHIDLEHFLSSPHTQDDNNIIISNNNNNHNNNNNNNNNNNKNNDKAVSGRDLINNVLSDLFYMGECEDQSRVNRNTTCKTRSRSRKQLCPRICVLSSHSANSDVPDVREGRFSSRSKLRLTSSGSGGKVKEVDQVREGEEKGGWDLSKYSQTEVTVIDTSVACWKFEKVLYRSKNVWKVGDRKGKGLMSGDRKKRKERVDEISGGDLPKKKKLKKKLKLKLCSSLNYADKEGSTGLSKFDQGHDRGKIVAGNEKKRDNCSQVKEKSFGKKHIEEGSSVILIKSIPTTSKKNVSGVSNSLLKSSQR